MADSPADTSTAGTETDADSPGAPVAPQDEAAKARPKVSVPVLVAAGLGIALVVAAAITGITINSSLQSSNQDTSSGDSTGPALLVPVDAPQASSADCTNLVKNLPAALPNSGGQLARRPLAAPVQPGTAAWGPGDSPVVLRCGVEQPPEFTATSETLSVSGVRWLEITGDDAASWYAVDRSVCIALTLQSGLGTGPLQEVSATISGTLPPVAIHPNGG